MTASLSAYSLVNRNGMRFYLRNFPACAGMAFRGFIVSPAGCHSCESRKPVSLIIKISLAVSMEATALFVK
ncbi:MAG: hypothetical protein EVG15_03220 [Candidatus Acididesulfobacter diazotrophicus]|uniref:Uncharacterized protein n=1 Tax=Candidatus Acididesulfobacter diazotrophicus TaxID=2597226 RepID=A0A519BPD4_9DELT|nr:MAG: hypothetical protein EVG15_03220 [Candidatus Acididesulfobacter diazotrophicus]